MTNKIIYKDVTVIADLSGLTIKEKTEQIGVMTKAMQDNSLIVPTIDPPAVAVSTDVGLLLAKIAKHRLMEEALVAFTYEITSDLRKLSNTMVKKWAPQIQEACAGDVELIYKLCFSVKNARTKLTTATKGKVTNSFPIISGIETKKPLTHNLHIINNQTKSIAKPADALQTCVYGQIGGVEPTDINKMLNWGIVDRGNFEYNFDAADLDKAVYYMAGYISKKTKKIVSASPVVKAFIS